MRVDFYILPDDDESRRQTFLCRLTEKAARSGLRVWIHAPDTAQALDERLWTFSQGSFVAHEPAGPDADGDCPVLIGGGDEPGHERQVLINDDSGIPPFAARFERVAEVINADPQRRNAGRDRFREYREQGHELHHHEVA